MFNFIFKISNIFFFHIKTQNFYYIEFFGPLKTSLDKINLLLAAASTKTNPGSSQSVKVKIMIYLNIEKHYFYILKHIFFYLMFSNFFS